MSKSILDLPNELFRDVLFKYLKVMDIFSLGETGNKRLRELAQDYIGYLQGIFYYPHNSSIRYIPILPIHCYIYQNQ